MAYHADDEYLVADLGFSEGGFCYSIARDHAHFWSRDFLLYLSINPFSIKIYAKAC